MTDVVEPDPMSRYERRRWEELKAHWEKKAEGRHLLPPRAEAALGKAGEVMKATATKGGSVIADKAPEKVKELAGSAVDAALVPTVHHVVRLLELLNDWVVELTDPEAVLKYHRGKGRAVESLEDLKTLDLELLARPGSLTGRAYGEVGSFRVGRGTARRRRRPLRRRRAGGVSAGRAGGRSPCHDLLAQQEPGPWGRAQVSVAVLDCGGHGGRGRHRP
jgi:hypothetical protein